MVGTDQRISGAKGLIFDCDGTLANTSPVYFKAWKKGFQNYGITITHDWYRSRNGLSESVLIDAFERQYGVEVDKEAVVRTMRAEFTSLASGLAEIPAIAAIARERFGHVPLAVASGGPASIVNLTLQATGLRHLFDAVVTVDDIGHPKPAPDLFLEAARRIGVSPEDCLVFEDSLQGITGARAAHMNVIDIAAVIVVA